MPETYAYNEDRMMAGIERFKQHDRAVAISLVPTQPALPPISRLVVERIASLFEKSGPHLLGRSRERRLAPAREAIVLVLHKRYGYSFARIGRTLRRHHTSILYSFQKAVARLDNDAAFREKVELVLNEQIHPGGDGDLAVFDLDRLRDGFETILPQTLHTLAESIESGEIEAKAVLMTGAGAANDPRAHCVVKIRLVAPIRKQVAAQKLEVAE